VARPRAKVDELKYTKEIIIYMVQKGNEPLSAREIADGLELNYSQVRTVIARGLAGNRFKQVWIKPKTKSQANAKYYVSTIKTFEEIKKIYGIELERSTTEEGNSVIFVKNKGEGGGITSVAPLSKNISVEGRPVIDWMQYMANRDIAMQGLAEIVNTWPQILGEMADIALRGLQSKDQPLTTQLRVDKLYNELNRRMKIFERMLSILQQVKENPLFWMSSFYREEIQRLKDLHISEAELAQYARGIETNYGKLVFNE